MELIWIDEYVEGVIDYCYSNDIFEIYNILDISIIEVDKNYALLQGSDAMYIRNYLGTEVVFVRDNLPHQYKKFVLSHELGHAILHVELARAAYNNKLIIKEKLEQQANYFACKLLDFKLDEVYHYGMTTEQIAKDLHVTEESIEHIKEVIK